MKSLTIPGIFAWTNPVFDCQAKAIILNILHWFLANATVLRERNVAAGFIDLFSITGVHRPIFPLELDRIRTDQALTFCLPPRPLFTPHCQSSVCCPLLASPSQSPHGTLEPPGHLLMRKDRDLPRSHSQ